MVSRRQIILGIGAGTLTAPLSTYAQQTERVWRLGWLDWNDRGRFSEVTGRAFVEGLRDAGFVEGRNLSIEKRVAFGELPKLSVLARELATLNVDVLFTPSQVATNAAWYASRTIPTVIALVADPVVLHYANSLSRPGKHITGVTTASADLTGKRLELLHEATSGAKRIAVLYDKTLYDSCQEELKQFRSAAAKLGISLVEAPVPNLAFSLAELEPTFRRMVEAKAQAVVMPLFTSVSDLSPEIARLALKYRLPTMHEVDDAATGYLLTYGPDFADVYRRAAGYVARIFKGAKPADMPIEEPRSFVLTVNLKVARALGIVLPQSILIRAERVTE